MSSHSPAVSRKTTRFTLGCVTVCVVITMCFVAYFAAAPENTDVLPTVQDLYERADSSSRKQKRSLKSDSHEQRTTIGDTKRADGDGNNNQWNLAEEHPVEGARKSGEKPIFVRAIRSSETNPILVGLNAPYHILRRSIRANIDSGASNPHRVHTFFTMDCTDHSIWQAGALEYSWEKIGQEGLLTRIISGCEKAPQAKVERSQRHFLRDEKIAKERRGSFYAPYASTLPSGRHYAPFNRPHGVYYWLKHADLAEEIFVMLDPDMIFLNTLPTESVRLGKPMSQVYDYMQHTAFEKLSCDSCPKWRFNREPYAVGPPWMMHLSDWIRVTPRWIQICQDLAEKHPENWIAEMIAYSLACKMENLPHSLTYRAMVDNFDDKIVWDDRTDLLTVARISDGDGDGKKKKKADGDNNDNVNDNNKAAVVYPSTLHYCYTLEVGEPNPKEDMKFDQHRRMEWRDKNFDEPVLDYYHFSKYRVPTDWPGGRARYPRNFMSCECPLLQEWHSTGHMINTLFHEGGAVVRVPTDAPAPAEDGRSGDNDDAGTQQQQQQTSASAKTKKKKRRTFFINNAMMSVWKRSGLMLELLLPAINDAMTVYKNRYCDVKVRNLTKALRTSHPEHWISRWSIDEWDESGENVKYHRRV